ncbi:polyhydroxybutyrate depolymerase [Stappia sp. F7233]|uniref:Polyhydroxybutyrate depolymerase n=1 Tax=Stappia albiluteola TaxID=2758565 RepID=A0A839A8Q4_9HYPH|nr:polyhydroxybutyrate depolymerase [Stappia albiluteola]MBA5775903.1 polyhydroxybutyrate depolymerase [Stappia albiluteola]
MSFLKYLFQKFLSPAAMAALLAASPMAAAPASACGPDTPCQIEGGDYRIRFPSAWDGKTPIGAIVFVHGWRGSAAGEMRNRGWAKLADELNVAFIAANGEGGGWSYPGSPRRNRDEFAYFEALIKDATTRFPIRRDRMMASGFSIGGSMVWNIACYRSELFAGYAPIAGAFWDPIPDTCPSPTPILFHVHGTSDRTVPLAGRPIGALWHQGDVAQGLAVWQKTEGLPVVFPKLDHDNNFSCQRQRTGDGLLEVCLHPGGHSVRAEWVKRAWRELGKQKGW